MGREQNAQLLANCYLLGLAAVPACRLGRDIIDGAYISEERDAARARDRAAAAAAAVAVAGGAGAARTYVPA